MGLLRELIESFFRAALLEEIFKFHGFMKANKKYQFKNEKEYMLGAGMIGLAYGIIEKVASGQEEGKEAISLEPGKVITIPANVKHWHGAKKDSWFSHIAVEVPGENTSNEWCETVTDNIYNDL